MSRGSRRTIDTAAPFAVATLQAEIQIDGDPTCLDEFFKGWKRGGAIDIVSRTHAFETTTYSWKPRSSQCFGQFGGHAISTHREDFQLPVSAAPISGLRTCERCKEPSMRRIYSSSITMRSIAVYM
jgi:hypothetical protein